jgi:hypothetical protein
MGVPPMEPRYPAVSDGTPSEVTSASDLLFTLSSDSFAGAHC